MYGNAYTPGVTTGTTTSTDSSALGAALRESLARPSRSAPGRPPTFRPFRIPTPAGPAYGAPRFYKMGLFGAALTLYQLDPRAAVAASSSADAYLTQFLPEWYNKPGWYNLEGWKNLLGFSKTPGSPGGYILPYPGGAGWVVPYCQITDGPWTAMATAPIGAPSPCTLLAIRVPSAAYGDPIPAGTNTVMFGNFNASQTRMSQEKLFFIDHPTAPWPYTQPKPTVYSPLPVEGQVMPVGFNDPAFQGVGAPDPLPEDKRLAPARSPLVPPYGVPARTVTLTAPGGAGVPPAVTYGNGVHNNLPPGPGKKEHKIDLYGAPGSLTRKLGNLGGSLSELKDFINAVSDSIGTGYSPRAGLREVKNPCKGLPLHEKISCVVQNAGHINWRLAIHNLAVNELQDRAIGMASKKINSNFAKKGLLVGGRGYTISRYATGNNPQKVRY